MAIDVDAMQQDEGWASLENMQAKADEAAKAAEAIERAERRRQIAIVRAALGNEAGRVFMTWLRTKSVDLPPLPAGAYPATAEGYAIYAARADGRRQLYLLIDAILAGGEDTEEKT